MQADLSSARGFVFDVDGTLVHRDPDGRARPQPGAIEVLERIRETGRPLVLFTNGSHVGAEAIARGLREDGLPIDDDELLTPVESAITYLRRYHRDEPALLFCSDVIRERIAAAGEAAESRVAVTLARCVRQHELTLSGPPTGLDSAPTQSAVSLPQDVADLPLVEVDAQGTFANRVAIILTGDGGWAGLDVAVADQLSKRGIEVVGLNTLKFFWQTRKPEEAADAVTRIIGHYGAKHPQADFVFVGYSFGAALSPVVVNRLPSAAQSRVAAQVLISPDPEAVFEIHVGDWFGSTHHEGAIPIMSEIDKTKVPVICVNGADEGAGAFCPKIAGKPMVKLLTSPGAHHYNGDYDKLGASIVASLPAKK